MMASYWSIIKMKTIKHVTNIMKCNEYDSINKQN